MRKLILAAGAVLTLSACGGGGSEANNTSAMGADANMMATDNMMAADNMMAGDNMMMDQNAMNGAMMGGNMAVDPATQNMMMKDMNTNSPDTNLANGM